MVVMFGDKKNISPMGILKLSEKFVLFCQPIWSPYHVWLRAGQWWPNCKLKTCVSLPHKHRKRLDNLYNIQLNCSLAKGPCHETANITNTSFYDFSVYRTPELNCLDQSSQFYLSIDKLGQLRNRTVHWSIFHCMKIWCCFVKTG